MKIKFRSLLSYFEKRMFNLFVRTFVFLFLSYSFGSISKEDTTIRTNKKVLQQQIIGTVLDENGQPLPGVNILEKNTSNGIQTDFDGNFTISTSNANPILVVSYLGYKTKEVSVKNQTELSIVLEEDVAALEEVIVVGYSTIKKKNITGAVSRINLEDSPSALTPTTNILQSLQGVSSGINVGTSNSVGETPSITVRGQNSISSTSNEPLIVLDGVIFIGSVTDINPSDIATIDILKDASSAAAYGSRSANGVVMITTKKGKTEKPLIRFSTSTGVNVWQQKPQLLGTQKYLEKYAAQNGFDSADDISWEGAFRTALYDQRVETDWLDFTSQTGVVNENNVSVSGRKDKVNYFFSGGYVDQEGVIIGDQFKRISVKSRLDVDVTDWLNVSIDGTYNNNDYSGVQANLRFAYLMAPFGYPYRYDNQPYDVVSNTSTDLERYPTGSSIQNPLWGTDGTARSMDKRNYFLLTATAEVKVPWVDGLSYRVNYSTSTKKQRQESFYYEDYYVTATDVIDADSEFIDRYSTESVQNNLSQANGTNVDTNTDTYVINNVIDYSQTFNKNFVNLTLVATRDYNSVTTNTFTGSDFSEIGNTILGSNGLYLAGTQETTYSITEETNVGYLAKLGYAFDNKYHLNASIRRDGASVFGAEKRYGTFSSLGLAWTLTEEDFLKNSKVLNYLKINGSYGTNGNQSISAYQTLATVALGNSGDIEYEFGDGDIEYGIRQTSLENNTLGWESTTSFNVGLQSTWLNNKLFLDVDYYTSQTKDQIFTRQIPALTGYSTILSSLGQVDNTGLEINLRSTNIQTKNFNWSSSLMYWRNRNKIASLYGEDADGDGKEDDDISNSYFIGKSIGAIYGYEYVGVVQADDTEYLANVGGEAGDPMFKDLNGDGLIDADNDRKILGYTKANFSMSLSNTITYKNFTFFTLFNGIFGGNGFYQKANQKHNSFAGSETDYSYNQVDNGEWWTPENESTTNLRPGYVDSRYLGLQSRAFIKLQKASLSYQFPKDILSKIGPSLSSLELYASGSNLYTFTNWFGGGDPEEGIAAGGTTLPVYSSYSLGLNISF
ncbi:SusC/RagA family TonB-linked outer membrane protein [Cellulophaga baltica]|uniref:SusC/RagA family TonB-linked outer membrane protein n=1 Tax=Cellulophaga TaxID=104264 RepID=UPI001C06B10E|nr:MULTISPECIES: SusC/RagA family TonB-linked outer membrane protein [Cellulophaga]MBU2996680.1 SusC/RagA family TonB-linked outer membrane protein [Cellulophaga baltica]MDO6768074.1 SusC/RagA family TonB-linked outer membrane protein [Cellulophaga sp. 1_MG-2023]